MKTKYLTCEEFTKSHCTPNYIYQPKEEGEKQPVWQPVAKVTDFHFSASESDNEDNDFSFITKTIGEKIEDMDKVS